MPPTCWPRGCRCCKPCGVRRTAAAWLGARPQLGHDLFRRGLPETLVATDRSELAADLPALVRGYLEAMRRVGAKRRYRPQPMTMWSVQEALQRLERMLGSLPDWTSLIAFLPEDHVGGPLQRRAALAATLLAGLEMARGGALLLRQEAAFGPILVRRGAEETPSEDEPAEGDEA